MKSHLDEARAQLSFGDVMVGKHGKALDTLSKEDRPAIQAALEWACQLADSRGDQLTEGRAAWPMYHMWPR